MKKILSFFITGILSSTFLEAQVTLTYATHGYAIGDVRTTFPADTNANPGSPGVGQIWNFSNLFNATTSYSDTFVNPTSTQYGSAFPTSNIATVGPYYYSQSTSSLSYLGTFTSGDTILFSDPEIDAEYPFSYSNTFTDSFYSSYSDNPFGQRICSGTVTTTADASGTLILPTGSYPVLRIKKQIIYEDSGSSDYTYVNTCYFWYSATDKFPLLTISFLSVSDLTNNWNGNYKNVLVNAVVAGIQNEQNSSYQINLFPNPATENTTVNYTLTEKQKINISVSNLQGKIILNLNRGELSPGKYSETINLASLSKGIYFVKVAGEKSFSCKKLVVE